MQHDTKIDNNGKYADSVRSQSSQNFESAIPVINERFCGTDLLQICYAYVIREANIISHVLATITRDKLTAYSHCRLRFWLIHAPQKLCRSM